MKLNEKKKTLEKIDKQQFLENNNHDITKLYDQHSCITKFQCDAHIDENRPT